MIRFRNHAALVIASTLAAACATGGGNESSAPAGYPASYSSEQARIQQLAGSRYNEQSIRQAQRALGEKGFDVGAIDGIWGPSSQSVMRNFQQAKGLTADGRLGREALAALDVSAGGARAQDEERAAAGSSQARQGRDHWQASRTEARQAGHMQQAARADAAASGMAPSSGDTRGMDTSGMPASGATAEGVAATRRGNGELEAFYDTRTVLEVQRALANRGFEVGRVDGVWGPQSQSALRNFQQDQRLESSGRINERTLAALDVAPGAGERREGATR